MHVTYGRLPPEAQLPIHFNPPWVKALKLSPASANSYPQGVDTFALLVSHDTALHTFMQCNKQGKLTICKLAGKKTAGA